VRSEQTIVSGLALAWVDVLHVVVKIRPKAHVVHHSFGGCGLRIGLCRVGSSLSQLFRCPTVVYLRRCRSSDLGRCSVPSIPKSIRGSGPAPPRPGLGARLRWRRSAHVCCDWRYTVRAHVRIKEDTELLSRTPSRTRSIHRGTPSRTSQARQGAAAAAVECRIWESIPKKPRMSPSADGDRVDSRSVPIGGRPRSRRCLPRPTRQSSQPIRTVNVGIMVRPIVSSVPRT